MSNWIIQDDGAKGLAPLCDLRATFEQRTGGLTTLERLTIKMGCLPSGFTCDDANRAAMIAKRTGLTNTTESATIVDHPVIKKPWEILDHLPTLLADDLEKGSELGKPNMGSVVGKNRVDVDPSVTIFPGVVFDATTGAIRIEAGATLRPNAVLCGPCWVGKGSTIIDGAHIKSNTSIGPNCKIGGEVGGTIIQGNTNKSHKGHIGDSVIGSWVNLGAGTTNSNLLNTYGDVIVTDLEGIHHRTKRQFVGCFVGDHAKFAIETRIMTGTLIGTGAMIATTQPAPSPTPRFGWHTDSGARKFRIEKFLDVAKTVMARRECTLDAATEVVLRELAG
jgi:UDP-N-acetylglucosamine diphosphorylase / glucose-1-phosphate thymidylyltransferase / UDP-N-acetylgalactosamine diphosphorylase / glucosamine-1-phosphate N-acetyltransferase / galactosamine-1-phosphate N-acetyltransferase